MTATFEGMTAEEAREFAGRWLPAWTGNQPERLAAFYAPDGVYRDESVPDGVVGRDAITAYFRVLLARNPDWVWTHVRSEPLAGGFLNHWHASIPVGDRIIECVGVCVVILDDD